MSSQYERRVHGAGLADAIDAADALFNPRGSPGQLETHDPSSPVLKVQSLAGHIRREKHRSVAASKAIDRGGALGGRLAAVEHGHPSPAGTCPFDRVPDCFKRMPELREDQDGLPGPFKQPEDAADFAFAADREAGERQQTSQPRSLGGH